MDILCGVLIGRRIIIDPVLIKFPSLRGFRNPDGFPGVGNILLFKKNLDLLKGRNYVLLNGIPGRFKNGIFLMIGKKKGKVLERPLKVALGKIIHYMFVICGLIALKDNLGLGKPFF